jgi:hypothetical protein
MVIIKDEDSATQTNRNYRKGLLILIKLPLPHDYCVHLGPCVFEWLICFEMCCSYALRQHVATTLKTCLLKNVFVFLAQHKLWKIPTPCGKHFENFPCHLRPVIENPLLLKITSMSAWEGRNYSRIPRSNSYNLKARREGNQPSRTSRVPPKLLLVTI